MVELKRLMNKRAFRQRVSIDRIEIMRSKFSIEAFVDFDESTVQRYIKQSLGTTETDQIIKGSTIGQNFLLTTRHSFHVHP